MSDIPKADLLRQLGYASHHTEALAILAAEGLTSARKGRIALAKKEKVAEVLARHFFRACSRGDCQARAAALAGGKTVVAAANRADCNVCGGSAAARALADMKAACRRAGWTRLCIVGGSPNARQEIQRTGADPIEFRLIDGTTARTTNLAKGDLAWADHVVLWGSTQLDHKVSSLYAGAPNCTTVAKRSVQALWAHVAEAATRSAAGGRGPREP